MGQKLWFDLPPSRNVIRQSTSLTGLNYGNTTLEVSMRRIALAALACAAFSAGAGQSASAADLPVKAPRVAAPIQYAEWSGVYVGVEGGYGWGRQSGDSSVPFNNFR